MIVYKIIDEFSRETGKKIGERTVFDHMICDFTGKKINEFYGNPVIYEVDYNDTDPCFGDHEAERWIYDFNRHLKFDEDEEGIDTYELFGQAQYVFGTEEDGTETFAELVKEAAKQKFEIISLDHLLRWSRGKMLERLLKEGKYNINQFICER